MDEYYIVCAQYNYFKSELIKKCKLGYSLSEYDILKYRELSKKRKECFKKKFTKRLKLIKNN